MPFLIPVFCILKLTKVLEDKIPSHDQWSDHRFRLAHEEWTRPLGQNKEDRDHTVKIWAFAAYITNVAWKPDIRLLQPVQIKLRLCVFSISCEPSLFLSGKLLVHWKSMRIAKDLRRLCGCLGWSESVLVPRVIKQFFSRHGLFITHHVSVRDGVALTWLLLWH